MDVHDEVATDGGILERTREVIPRVDEIRESYIIAASRAVAPYRVYVDGFAMERQLRRNWCWSAVAVSTDSFYEGGKRFRQCELASVVLGLACCGDGCDRPYYLERSLRTVGRLRTFQTRPAGAEELQMELAERRVIGVLINWRGGGGHFVAITGIEGTPRGALLQVDDPRNGATHSLLAAHLRSEYKGSGVWAATYFTAP